MTLATRTPTSNMTLYTYCGQTLTSVNCHCYLGIHLSNTLNWTNQTKVARTEAQQTLGVIRRNLNKCPTHIKAVAYTSLVRPILEYASAAWDPHQRPYRLRRSTIGTPYGGAALQWRRLCGCVHEGAMARPWTGNGQFCSAINGNNRRKTCTALSLFRFPVKLLCMSSDSLFGGGAIGIVNNVFKLILLVTYLTLMSCYVL